MRLLAVMLTASLAGCASIPPPLPAGRIILDEEHATTVAYWKPSEDEVQSLERELARMFVSRDRRVSGMEGAKLSEYGVKYYGAVEAGRRVIIGKGVHLSQRSLRNLQEENDRPGIIALDAFGGGSLYFTLVYDPATRKIVRVRANAAL
jgi:hypothetical protein